jgi:hypothetical protein
VIGLVLCFMVFGLDLEFGSLLGCAGEGFWSSFVSDPCLMKEDDPPSHTQLSRNDHTIVSQSRVWKMSLNFASP